MNPPYDWHEIEQPAGPPVVPNVDPAATDEHRKAAYQSFEAFLDRHIRQLHEQRDQQWRRDYSSIDAYLRSVEPMRETFKRTLGWWIEPAERPPIKTRSEHVLLEQPDFVARRMMLEILPGLETYAIELIPTAAPPRGGRAGLLVQHGYSGTPEYVCGFTPDANSDDYNYRSLGVRAVRRGYHVVAVHHPAGYGSRDTLVDRPMDRFAKHPGGYGQNRLHRLALLGGATAMGLFMLASSRGIDLLRSRDDVDPDRIGMYGLSQGGTSTLFLSAMDQRIGAAVCSAFFNARLRKTIGPISVTAYIDWQDEASILPDFLPYFSDSDVVSLIAPRAFAVEAGLGDGSVHIDDAYTEFQQAAVHYRKLGLDERVEFIAHRHRHTSATRRAFDFLARHLTV